TILHSFAGPEGTSLDSGLLLGGDGNFYGTTPQTTLCHGSVCSGYGGTVFRMKPDGTLITLHVFRNTAEGWQPGPLADGFDGLFYGMTEQGGAGGEGTTFSVASNGAFTTLNAFGGANGGLPHGALLLAADGNFYGTTSVGGANNKGTIFRMTPSGAITTLHSFSGGDDGATPYGSLVQGSDGRFYGGTGSGGNGIRHDRGWHDHHAARVQRRRRNGTGRRTRAEQRRHPLWRQRGRLSGLRDAVSHFFRRTIHDAALVLAAGRHRPRIDADLRHRRPLVRHDRTVRWRAGRERQRVCVRSLGAAHAGIAFDQNLHQRIRQMLPADQYQCRPDGAAGLGIGQPRRVHGERCVERFAPDRWQLQLRDCPRRRLRLQARLCRAGRQRRRTGG